MSDLLPYQLDPNSSDYFAAPAKDPGHTHSGGSGTGISSGEDSVEATGDGYIAFTINGNPVNFFAYTANPNGNVTAIAEGDVCFDTGTPAIWLADGAGTEWTEVTAGAIDEISNADDSVTATGEGYVTLTTLDSSINFFVNGGNPNGIVTALEEGDICFDTATPGLWVADGAGTEWTQLGAGGGGSPTSDDGTVVVSGSDLSIANSFAQVQVAFRVEDAVYNTYQDEENVFLTSHGPSGLPINSNYERTTTTHPALLGAAGTVLNIEAAGINTVDTSNADAEITVNIVITDMLGTNIMQITGSAVANAGVENDNCSVDFTSATVTAVAGGDLVWDGSANVTSTAGGVYVVEFTRSARFI